MATHKKEWLALGAAVPVVLYAAIQLGGVVHRRQSLKSSTTTDYPLSTSSVAEVSAWLRSRGISAATVNALARAGANGEAMCQLSMDDLLRMNVPTQDVAGICAAIVEMRSAERNQSTTATVVEAATLVITHLATPSTTMLPQHARRLMCELLEQYALLSVEQQRSAIARLAGPGPMATPRQPATREATADSTQQTMSGTAEMQLRAGAKAVEQMLDRYLKVLSSEQFRTAAPEVVERIAQEADRIQAVMDSLPDAIAGPLRAKWNAVQEALRDATPAQSAADPRASAVRAQSVAAGDVVADLKRTFSSIRAVSTLPAGERSQTLLGLQEEMNKIGARLATVSGKEEMKMASQVFLQVSELLDMAIQAEGMSAQLPDGINQDDVAGDDDEDDSTDVTERIQRVVMTLKSPAFLRLTGSERATAVATLRAEVERIRRDVSSLPTEVRAQIVQIVDAMQQMLEMVPEEEAPSVAAPSAPAGANALTPQQQKLIAMIIHIRRTVMAPAFEKAPPSQKQGLLSTATQCAETLRAIGGAEVEEIDRELVRPLLEYLEAVTAPAHADYFRQVMETLQEIGETVISPTFIEQDPATRREVATSILMQLERVCESVQSLPEREREAAKEVVSSITSILEQIVRNAPGSTEEEEDEDEEDEETSGDLNGDILKTLKHVMSQIQLPILQEASEEERGEMISSHLNVLLRLKKRCEKNASVHPTSLRVLDSLIAQLQSIVPSANAEEEEGEEVQELDATAVGDKGAMTMEVFKETFVRVLHILSNTTFSSEDEVLPPMLATEKAITAADGANLPWRDDETAFTLVSTALKAIDEVQKKIAQARHGAKAEQVLQAMVTQLTEHPPTSVADLASYFAMINELRTTQLPAAAESQLGDIQELIMRYAQQLTTAQPRSEEEANSISNNNNSTSASSHSAAASEMLMEISNRICEASAITPEELDQYERFIAALEEGMTDEDTLEALASIKEQISLERVRYANAEEAAAADGDDDEDDDDEDGDEEEDENES